MNKITQIKITSKMEEIRDKLPSWKDGGPNQQEIFKAGLLHFQTQYKFSRESELFETLKRVFN